MKQRVEVVIPHSKTRVGWLMPKSSTGRQLTANCVRVHIDGQKSPTTFHESFIRPIKEETK